MSERRRAFVLVSFLVDDNDDPVTEATPVAGTTSDKVARAVVEKFIEARNERTTMLYTKEANRVLPGLIPAEVESETLKNLLEETSEIRKGTATSLIDDILKG